ncbi:quinolinate synthetase [Arenibacter nanhaiticus]|uniref:Quinolinate synthase n=1 Tax=Arenibacter nanhaiticus TaxID=558155 RepID=A0A1M6A199_9FLAO|nr:quinolinate synthase NadA [Arenibacter nanhaiticus]SHI30235.1 quinolinate synthetase [Arenibacter nanhaiticus]
MDLKNNIIRLKQEKNAIILAHYYQRPEIQEIADYVGDSLGLSQKAADTDADIIVFAGVHFMAETAKILNPAKTVLLPDLKAGCSLADSCPPASFKKFKEQHPDHYVVTYINCSAEIKAMSDVVCTSSNAVQIVAAVPKDRPIIFAPDRNLGKYVAKKTGRDLLLWDGACEVHQAFSIDKLLTLYRKYPKAKIIVHPESEDHLLGIANFIGSTAQMIEYVKKQPGHDYIVATEAGILHKMQEAVPNTVLIPAPAKEDNSCACSECAFMKVNTLEKIYDSLRHGAPEIQLPEALLAPALLPIQRMLEHSK